MINIDGATPLPPSRMPELISAVLNAQPEDECDWAEWKSTLSLADRPSHLAIARAILGFANRNPATSQQPFGGSAYVIIGAQPGQLVGVKPVDMATLQPQLSHYLGTPGPFWRHEYVTPTESPETTILVIEVLAPRPGDWPYPLAHEGTDASGKTVPSGTLFTRRGAKTERANYSEVLMLINRATQSPPSVKITDVDVWGTISVEWDRLRHLDLSDPVLDQWLEMRRQALLRKTQEDAIKPMGLTRLWSDQDIRAYSRTVDEYLDTIRPFLREVFVATFIRQGYNSLCLGAINRSDEHLSELEAVLIMRPAACVVDPAVDPGSLPKPQLAQLPDMSVGLAKLALPSSHAAASAAESGRAAKTRIAPRWIGRGPSATYTESMGTLRAKDSTHGCTIQLMINDPIPELNCTVELSSTSLPGRSERSESLPVESTTAAFLATLIDPDPAVPRSLARRFPATHTHHH